MDAKGARGMEPGGLPGSWDQERLAGEMSSKPAGGTRRVGAREEPGVSRCLLQRVCREEPWTASPASSAWDPASFCWGLLLRVFQGSKITLAILSRERFTMGNWGLFKPWERLGD